MKSIIKIVVVTLLGLFFNECSMKISMTNFPEALVLEKYGDLGNLISKQIIKSPDVTYELLKNLVDKEKDGWKGNFVSYKTGPYVLRSDHWVFRCYDNFAIIDTFEDGNWISIKKNIPQLLEKLHLTPIENK
ncbi:MAG: hypothetical protein IPJ69_00315 [Deltaproteobacteria bacterium]|nr:MAG: hypothetical protein IPJ69_00315 [Deltaproteobacteria bacterium]